METNNNLMNINYEDKEKMNELLNIRNKILKSINMNKFIEKAKEIIDQSESFTFRSERVKKFISPENPEFILSCIEFDNGKIDLEKLDITKLDSLTQKITRLADKELISNFGANIKNYIIDKETFDKTLKELPEKFREIFFTSIYTIRVSPKEKAVIIRYFV